jgi:hypothetical protein
MDFQSIFSLVRRSRAVLGRRQRQGRAISIEVEHNGVDILEIESSGSEPDCIVVAAARPI